MLDGVDVVSIVIVASVCFVFVGSVDIAGVVMYCCCRCCTSAVIISLWSMSKLFLLLLPFLFVSFLMILLAIFFFHAAIVALGFVVLALFTAASGFCSFRAALFA